jgi:probable HAF family extracellular repeat protein
MKRSTERGLLVPLALAMLTLPRIVSAQVEFLPLGDLQGGELRTTATQISPLSEFVVGSSSSAATGVNAEEAVVWDALGNPMALGSLEGGNFSSTAHAATRDGESIVGASSSAASGVNSVEAFLFRAEDQTMIALGDLAGGAVRSVAYAISADGSAAVGSSSSAQSGSNADQAVLWQDGATMPMNLGSLPGGSASSEARAVSQAGEVVAGSASSSGSGVNNSEAFRWTDEAGMVGLGFLPGGGTSRANGISADGLVIVGGSSSTATGSQALEAFRWTQEDQFQSLGDLPGGSYQSEALAASASGAVIVGVSNSSVGDEAFVWDETNEMRALFDVVEAGGIDLSGWRFTSATGVSGDGEAISGNGINPAGRVEAFVVRLPEPGAQALGAVALAAVLALRRRATR